MGVPMADARDALFVLAGEYALGLLHGPARDQFEALCDADDTVADMVAAWERALAPLIHGAPAITPPPHLWERIERATLGLGPIRSVTSGAGTPATLANTPADTPEDPAEQRKIIRLRASRRRWQWVGTVASLAAAASIGFLLLVTGQIQTSPDLPPWIQVPQPKLAVLVSEDRSAALVVVKPILGRARATVLTAEAPAEDRALELWAITAPGQAPQSLGLLPRQGTDRLARPLAPIPVGATLAVSVEPRGGSPTGQPTGPVLYTGPLVTAK